MGGEWVAGRGKPLPIGRGCRGIFQPEYNSLDSGKASVSE